MARGDAPRDSYHLVGISFFILGLGTLLPWNFFITAIPYFQARLAGDSNSTARTLSTNHTAPEDAFNFNNWVTLLSQLPLLLFTLLNSFLYQCIPETVRILGSLLAILLLFALTAALVKVDMSPRPFFSITMASVCFINSFSAVLQGSLFGQLGIMPSTYSTLFLSGQGLAGIFAALAMLLSMASGVDAQTSALGYFITPCVGILMSIVCYLSLPHLKFARYYLAKKPSQAQAQELETKAELLHSGQFFNPICCFLLFNIMDCLGRSLTSYFLWTRTAGCCPCWSACASCSCPSSCCATCPRGPGCPSSSRRMPTSSPSCCSLPFLMATWCPSPCAWRPGLGEWGGVGAESGEVGFFSGEGQPSREGGFVLLLASPTLAVRGPRWLPLPGKALTAGERRTGRESYLPSKVAQALVLGPPRWASVSPSVK
ncbi:equilibrative nucleoside transporter 2 isoform X7 [Callithrix jacchus]|uniref:equilibrative nucleoside transporter 2 isoform X9 n=1 Tax=Callithrix jacchus TaxID=9483 RepID=UPI00159E6E13|nr:equilibrative nucleoside transporter 2 isoform X9 [Callithrix jacchus]